MGKNSPFWDSYCKVVQLISPRYKPVGRNVGGIKGQRDGFESYAVSTHTK